MNNFKSSAGFVLPAPDPRPVPAKWPLYLCAVGTVLAGCVTLIPSVGHRWSQAAYPALVAVDRMIAPLGVSIDPNPAPDAPVPRPVIAIVFGCIQPDETVEEPSPSEKPAETSDKPEVVDLKSVTHPASWRRPLGETSYEFDTSQFRN